jgi:hypothetical protein
VPLSGVVPADDQPCPFTPRCWDMLADPVGVLSNTARWPTHLCTDMLEESVRLWAEQHLKLIEGTLRCAWPLPVGRQGAAKSYWLRQEPDQLPTPLDSTTIAVQMPFDGDESALLAIHTPLGSGALDLFGFGTEEMHEHEETYDFTYKAFPLRYGLRGDLSVLHQAQPLVNAAANWWGKVNTETYKIYQGQRRRGRPPGTGAYADWTPQKLIDEYLTLKRELGRRPTQADLAPHLGVADRGGVKDLCTKLGLSWPPA